MRQRPDRHEVSAGAGDLGYSLERHAARHFDLGASLRTAHRLANLIDGHVVDEDHPGAGRERLARLDTIEADLRSAGRIATIERVTREPFEVNVEFGETTA